MSDTLSIRLEHGSPGGDAERSTKDREHRASSALIPTAPVTDHDEVAPGGAAAAALDTQSGFDYAAVPDIAGELRETAARVRQHRLRFLVEIGRDIRGWRARLPYGQFNRWIKQECKLEVRMAQLAMTVACYADSLDERQCENFSRLPVSAQYLLAAPSTHDSVREEVLGGLADGRSYKVDEVKQLIRGAQGKNDRADSAVQRNGWESAAHEDEPDTELPSEGAPVEEEAFRASDVGRTGSQPALVESTSVEVEKAVHLISQSKLAATTADQSKQAIINGIYAFTQEIAPVQRTTLISNLSKLGDITASSLAVCLQ